MKHFSFSQVVTDESSLLAIGLMEGGAIALFGLESILDGGWGYSTIWSGWIEGL